MACSQDHSKPHDMLSALPSVAAAFAGWREAVETLWRSKPKLLFFLLFTNLMAGQTSGPSSLVRTALENYEAREEQSKDYEYLEKNTTTDLGETRSEDRSRTRVYEVMIVNGRQLRRELVNGEPLTPQEIEEEHRLTAAAGRDWADHQVTAPNTDTAMVVHGGIPKLSLKNLPYFFEMHLARQEAVDGRNTFVIDAKPKSGQKPSDEIENDLRTFKLRIWIDQAEMQIIRIKAVAIHEGVLGYSDYVKLNPRFSSDTRKAGENVYGYRERYARGTTIVMDWRKVNDDAWLPTDVHVQGSRREPLYLTPLQRSQIVGDGDIDWPFVDDTVFYNYQKFGVTHRLLIPDTH